MRRAAGALARTAREGALRNSVRVVGTSAPSEAAAAAAAAAPAAKPAASAKPPNVQEFKIYRWNPDKPGEKPYLQSYKARRPHARSCVHFLRCAPSRRTLRARRQPHAACRGVPPSRRGAPAADVHNDLGPPGDAARAFHAPGGHQRVRAHDAGRAVQD